jgi:hypothetical protein
MAWLLWPLSPMIAFLLALVTAWNLAGPLWSLPAAIAALWLVGHVALRFQHLREWIAQPPSRKELTGYASAGPRPIGPRGEIGMGGPSFGGMLMPDGALLRGIADRFDIQLIGAGPLYLAACVERSGDTALVYDSAARLVHDLKLPIGTPLPELLAACAADAAPIRLWPVLGLLLDRDVAPPPRELERRLPSGRVLRATRLVPDDLRGAESPEHWAVRPPYRLRVGSRSTYVYLHGFDGAAESPSGAAFIVRATRLNEHGGDLWHIWYRGAFHAVCVQACGEPSCTLEEPMLDDGGHVVWRVACSRWLPNGGTEVLPAPPQVAVKAHWLREPMLLATHDGRVTLALPARLPWGALRY